MLIPMAKKLWMPRRALVLLNREEEEEEEEEDLVVAIAVEVAT